MKYFREKRTIIFGPFLLLGAIFIPFYTLVRLFCLKLNVSGSGRDYWDFMIPCVLSFLVVTIFLRRRIKILSLAKGSLGHIMFGTMAIAVPTIIAQQYLQLVTNPVTHIHTAAYIPENDGQRFYAIDDYHIDTTAQYLYYYSQVSGKRNTDFTYYCATVIPFTNANGVDSAINVWYGLNFQKSISNSATKSEKEEAFKAFVAEVDNGISENIRTRSLYFENPGWSKPDNSYYESVYRSNPAYNGRPLILEPQFTPLATRIQTTLYWVFGFWAIGIVVFALTVFLTRISLQELKRYERGLPPAHDDFRDFFRWISRLFR